MIRRILRKLIEKVKRWFARWTAFLLVLLLLPGCFGSMSTKSITRDDRGSEKIKAALDSKKADPSPLIGGDVDTGGGDLTIGKETPRATEDRIVDVEQSSLWDMSVSEIWKLYSGWFFILFGIGFVLFVSGIGLLLVILSRAWKGAKASAFGQGIGIGIDSLKGVLSVVQNVTKHVAKDSAAWVEADRLEKVVEGKLDTLEAKK